MFCSSCGRPAGEGDRFCGGCGSAVPRGGVEIAPAASAQPGTHGSKAIFVTLAVLAALLLVLLLAIGLVYNAAPKTKTAVAEQGKKAAEKSDVPQPQQQGGEPTENDPDQTPRASEADSNSQPDGEVHPFEILRNPYGYKGRTLLLKVSRVPFVLHDVIVSTGDPRSELGFVAIQFERSVSETTALFGLRARAQGIRDLWSQVQP